MLSLSALQMAFITGAALLALPNAGGTIADIWNARERALATAFYSTAPFLGPGER